jgi:hypothetical protein
MSGRPPVKVYVYGKTVRAPLIEVCNSIQEFKEKYLPTYKVSSKAGALFKDQTFVEVGTYLCSLQRMGRKIYREYLIETNKYTKIGTDLKGDYPIEVFNFRGVKLAEFKSVRAATEITGIDRSTIFHSLSRGEEQPALKGYGLVFKKKNQ